MSVGEPSVLWLAHNRCFQFIRCHDTEQGEQGELGMERMEQERMEAVNLGEPLWRPAVIFHHQGTEVQIAVWGATKGGVDAVERIKMVPVGNQHLPNPVQDQHGTPMKLPEDQRQALMVGMALHGKGNAFWRQQDPHLALGCLVEADKRFRRCPEKLLQVYAHAEGAPLWAEGLRGGRDWGEGGGRAGGAGGRGGNLPLESILQGPHYSSDGWVAQQLPHLTLPDPLHQWGLW